LKLNSVLKENTKLPLNHLLNLGLKATNSSEGSNKLKKIYHPAIEKSRCINIKKGNIICHEQSN
jgi:hypothetical protein